MTTMSPPIDLSLALSDAKKKVASESLLPFTSYTFPRYIPERMHALISEKLDAVVRGDLMRLMIFAPPQSGKSELTSVRLPAFWLGRRPDDPIILASYAASLAESKSRQCRTLIESPEYSDLFPDVRLRRDSRSVSHWHLDGYRGYMLAAGVGGPVTGHGALLGIIDDPVENWQEAQSETVRDTAWEWFRTTFRTRIWEHGAIVLIQTRWHEDDLAGRILQDQAGEWEVLRLPAIAETQAERDESNKFLGLPLGESDPLGRAPGQPLTPKRFSLPALLAFKRDVGATAWAGQYQGTPRAPEGNRFKRSWFPIVEAAPYQATRVRYWDRGYSEDGDYTVGVLLARDERGIYYVEDMQRGQWSAGQRDDVMLQTAKRDAIRYNRTVKTWVEQEPAAGKEAVRAAVKLLAGFSVSADKVSKNKEVRADPIASQAEAGYVRMVRAGWNGAFLAEVTAFPSASHDDIVDALSGAFNKMTKPKTGPVLRIFNVGAPKLKQQHILVCNMEQLATVEMEEPAILLRFVSPPPVGCEEEPVHGITKLLGSRAIIFADFAPAEHQNTWANVVEPYGKPVSELLMTEEVHGKALWSFFRAPRPTPFDVAVFVDEGDRRAISAAYGVADTLQIPRSHVHVLGGTDNSNEGEAPNKHVYNAVRSSRSRVL